MSGSTPCKWLSHLFLPPEFFFKITVISVSANPFTSHNSKTGTFPSNGAVYSVKSTHQYVDASQTCPKPLASPQVSSSSGQHGESPRSIKPNAKSFCGDILRDLLPVTTLNLLLDASKNIETKLRAYQPKPNERISLIISLEYFPKVCSNVLGRYEFDYVTFSPSISARFGA